MISWCRTNPKTSDLLWLSTLNTNLNTNTEYKPPDSNAEQNHATTRFKSKNQGDGGENCEELANHERIVWLREQTSSKKVHEKAAETFSEFEKTSYELISRLEAQHEEHIGKLTDTWHKIDLKIKFQNHPSQKNITTNFNRQDNNETTVSANSTADNSTTSNKINTWETGQHQTSINGNTHNEQPETNNSGKRDNINSFWFDRLSYSSSLDDQQNRVTGMRDTQTFNQPTVQPQWLSTTFSRQVPFYTPYIEALPKMDLQKFNGEHSRWADWNSTFSFMIGDTHLSDTHKIGYLQGLVIEKGKTAIDVFACNGHLKEDAIKGSKLWFWNPSVIISNLLEKPINHRPPTTSLPWTIVNLSTFIKTKTLQETNFEADFNSTTILKHAAESLPYSKKI